MATQGQEQHGGPEPPPLPSLPPAPQLSDDLESWKPAQQNRSPFFFCFPPEIRVMILREAFDDRTIHIDWRPPPPTYPNPFLFPQRDPPPPPQDSNPFLFPQRDLPLRCSSHKAEDAYVMAWRCRVNTAGKTCGWDSTCAMSCLYDTSERRLAAPLLMGSQFGALGFLLSCKRAYHEACPILCATNIVFIESAALVEGLLRRNLPGCLAAPKVLIRSGMQFVSLLRLQVDFILFNERHPGNETQERARFVEDLDLLPHTFPKLQRLQLMFPHNMYYQRLPEPKNNAAELNTVLFGPLMKASRMMVLKEFSVTLPRRVFCTLMDFVPSWKTGDIDDLDRKQWEVTQVWYPFDSAQEEQGQPGRGFNVQRSFYP